MKKDTTETIPGIDLEQDSLRHEKRDRSLSVDALWSRVKKEAFVHPSTGKITFEPKQFDELTKLIFDTAYQIGLKERRKLDEWNERMA